MSEQTYETFLRGQVEKAQYGVVIIPARIALDMADFIEKKRANGTDINVGSVISRQLAIDATWEEPTYTDPINVLTEVRDRIKALPPAQPVGKDINVSCKDAISRQAAIDAAHKNYDTILDFKSDGRTVADSFEDIINALPPAQQEIIRCKDCKHWRQQTNYQGVPLSFGFCESDDMWCSLYGETTEVAHIDTDDNHYCGYAERRTE